ncbi:MAG: hypothetical protein LW832_06460 [Parachlamydia sp.]|jgi:hypothetical protein|nr:hypothetical protein [Parachlamydia sp.]
MVNPISNSFVNTSSTKFSSNAPTDVVSTIAKSQLAPPPSSPNKQEKKFAPLLEEIESFLDKKTNEIENHIGALKNFEQEEKILKAFIQAEKEGGKKLDLANEVIGGILDLAKNTKILNLGEYEVFTDGLKNFLETSIEYAKTLDTGAEVLAAIYRRKMLNESKKLLKFLKIKLVDLKSKEGNQEIVSKLTKIIKEMEIKIAIDEKNFKFQDAKLGLGLSKFTLKSIKAPITQLFDKGSDALKGATAAFSIVGALLGSLSASLEFYKKKVERHEFKGWTGYYAQWQQAHTTTVDPLDKTLISTLLKKREVILEEKIDLLIPSFDEILPAIKNLKKPSFLREWESFKSQIKHPNVTDEEIVALGTKFQVPNYFFGKSDRAVLSKWVGELSDEFLEEALDNSIAAEPKRELLKFYVDHQETVEITTKNAMKELVKKKHAIEAKFVEFNKVQSGILFTLAQTSAALSVALTLTGLVTTPVAGVGAILIALSVVSTLFSLGFWLAGSYYTQLYRPHTANVEGPAGQIKMLFKTIQMEIREYQQILSQKKIHKKAEILNQLKNKNSTFPEDKQKYEQALINYEEAKVDYAKRASKLDKWKEKLEKHQKQLQDAGWKDFALFALNSEKEEPHIPLNNLSDVKNFVLRAAGLQDIPLPAYNPPFDTGQAFNNALASADLSLLSHETKTLYERFLGWDMDELQKKTEAHSPAIKNALQKFFMMDDSAYIKFIQRQRLRLENSGS